MELNVELAKDEMVVSQYKFSYDILRFFVKSHFWITNKRLIANFPNFVAWIIPVSSNTITYPLNKIGSVKNVKKIQVFAPMFWVILFMLIGISTINNWVGVLFIILGIFNLTKIVKTYITIRSPGSLIRYKHVPWEVKNAEKMINELNAIIAEN
ncbi:MAG: hypothetical protein EBE86_006760 [Hormoscilla sp. GUM202]|nr:hypothetical protein [Hormoscilla sp. GUM202]